MVYILLILFGIVFILIGCFLYSLTKDLRRCKRTTKGKIIGYNETKDNNGKVSAYFPIFEYYVNNQTLEKEERIGNTSAIYDIGDEVKVAYNASNPSEATLFEQIKDLNVYLKISKIFMAIGVIPTIIGFLSFIINTYFDLKENVLIAIYGTIFCLIFIVIGLIFIIIRTKYKKQCTQKTKGKIIGTETKNYGVTRAKGKNTFNPIYEFYIDGKRYEKVSPYSTLRYLNCMGKEIDVYYNPENYEQSYFVGEITPMVLGTSFLVIGLVSILALIFLL